MRSLDHIPVARIKTRAGIDSSRSAGPGSNGEYKRGGVHTNSIESVWSLLKRGVYGTWHHISAKHVGRYVNEVTFRLNAGNVARHTLERLDSFIAAADGQRLTYKRLTA